jgi:hypothetical protein
MVRRLVIIGGDAMGMSAAAQARRMSAVGVLEIVTFERVASATSDWKSRRGCSDAVSTLR